MRHTERSPLKSTPLSFGLWKLISSSLFSSFGSLFTAFAPLYDICESSILNRYKQLLCAYSTASLWNRVIQIQPLFSERQQREACAWCNTTEKENLVMRSMCSSCSCVTPAFLLSTPGLNIKRIVVQDVVIKLASKFWDTDERSWLSTFHLLFSNKQLQAKLGSASRALEEAPVLTGSLLGSSGKGAEIRFSMHRKQDLSNSHFPKPYANQSTTLILWNSHISEFCNGVATELQLSSVYKMDALDVYEEMKIAVKTAYKMYYISRNCLGKDVD